MKPNSTWYANSQRTRILMMSVISGHDQNLADQVKEQVITAVSINQTRL